MVARGDNSGDGYSRNGGTRRSSNSYSRNGSARRSRSESSREHSAYRRLGDSSSYRSSGTSAASASGASDASSSQIVHRTNITTLHRTKSSVARAGNGAVAEYSRAYAADKYAAQRKKTKHKKVGLIVLAVFLALVLFGGGGLFMYLQKIQGNLHEGVDENLLSSLVDTKYAGDPFYMLLMGIDGSIARDNSAEYAGDTYRSDSMMLVRVDPSLKKVSIISLHRDTLTDMGEYGMQKLNAAHHYGGPQLVVETVSKMCDVDISHYAEINFDGFVDMVNDLGGVEVYVPMDFRDDDAGCYIDEGWHNLTGEKALALCRARHAYDAYGDGDVYRAANQRMVISALVEKILQSDPATIANTITTLSQYVATDFDVSEIISLGLAFRGIDTSEDIYSAMEPTYSEMIDGIWYEHLNVSEWEEMLENMKAGRPPVSETVIDDATGTVMTNAGD